MDWTRAAEAGFGDVERHFAGGERAGAYVGGGALLVRSGRAHFHTQHRHWNQSPG